MRRPKIKAALLAALGITIGTIGMGDSVRAGGGGALPTSMKFAPVWIWLGGSCDENQVCSWLEEPNWQFNGGNPLLATSWVYPQFDFEDVWISVEANVNIINGSVTINELTLNLDNAAVDFASIGTLSLDKIIMKSVDPGPVFEDVVITVSSGVLETQN